MRLRRNIGFTLVDLMVALAIVGVLAGIAYPSYVKQIVKSNRAAAQAVLMEIAQKQSEYLLDNRAYASDVDTLHVSVPSKVSGLYTITITASASSPPSFTAKATPIAGGKQESDGELTINSAGAKTPADVW